MLDPRPLWGAAFGIAFLLMHVSLYFAPLVPILAAAMIYERLPLPQTVNLILVGIGLVFAIEAIQTYSPERVMLILMALAGAGAAAAGLVIGASWPKRVRILIFSAAAVLLAANSLFYLAGIMPEGQRLYLPPNVILSYVGIEAQRAHFYFSLGINAYGTLAGFIFLLSAVDWFRTRSTLTLATGLMALAHTVLADSRGAILSAVIIAGLILLLRTRRFYLPVLVISLLAAPFLMAFADMIDAAFAEYARIDTDVSSGRIPYWREIFAAMSNHPFSWPFGLGLTGAETLRDQIVTPDEFKHMAMADDLLPGAHNLWIQSMLEGGLLKGGLFLAVLILAYKQAKQAPYPSLLICIAYVPLVGIFESSMDWTRFELLFVLFLLVGSSLSGRALGSASAAKHRPPRRRPSQKTHPS